MDDVLARTFANELTVLIVTALLLSALAEGGFRVGLRLHRTGDQARKGQIGSIQAAVLGLLGLLLGFTFAMAVDRYDRRRSLVLQEANAIGTTYLRGSLLPEAHQTPVKDLLRLYVDTRVKYQPLVDDPVQLAEGMRMSEEIKAKVWQHAVEAAREARDDITATFIESLNETIDADAERITAMRAHIPGGVWLLLMMVAAFGTFTTGYAAGADGARTMLSNLLLPLMITVVIVLVFDISHPRTGLIRISQQPLLDLQQSIKPT
jgi:Protein of unknown function (DUF4239)